VVDAAILSGAGCREPTAREKTERENESHQASQQQKMQGVAPAHPGACRARTAAAPYASRHAAAVAPSGARGATALSPPVPLRAVIWPLSLLSDGRRDRVTAVSPAAASVPTEDAEAKGDIAGTVQLGAMIVAWYLLNIYFNIYNKQVRHHFANREIQFALPASWPLFPSLTNPDSPPLQVLKVVPFPYTMTAFQLAFGSLLIFAMWATGLHPTPRISPAQVRPLSRPASCLLLRFAMD
jgi:solute carrier family 35, member E1